MQMIKKMTLAALGCLTFGLCAQSRMLLNSNPFPFEEGNDSWSCSASFSLSKGRQENEALLLAPGGWKKHPNHGYISGYNGDVTIRFRAPGPVTGLKAQAAITNYADSVKRGCYIAWSLNGTDFTPLDSKEFAAGKAVLDGSVKLPENRGILYLKFGRKIAPEDANGNHGFVLFEKISFALTGTYAKGSEKEKNASRELKNVFPTGVFWAWERTAPNAEYAKMELWQYVDFTMKTLHDNGYDTCWFVNLPVKEQIRILNMAQKHGLRALFNTELLGVFYNGAGSLSGMDALPNGRRTARGTSSAARICPERRTSADGSGNLQLFVQTYEKGRSVPGFRGGRDEPSEPDIPAGKHSSRGLLGHLLLRG